MPYPSHEAPSQRFRFEQYYSLLTERGHSYSIQSYYSASAWEALYKQNNSIRIASAVLIGFAKRFSLLGSLQQYNFIFIHREAMPLGPPFFEWLISRIFQKKIIYDFDDAIWLTDKTHENWLQQKVRWRSKVSSICQWSYKVSCGNSYLANYARLFNQQVIINPTTIDANQMGKSLHDVEKPVNSKITIGWTGSHSTLKYLEQIEVVLQQVEKKYSNVQFVVIADQKPILNLKSLKFIPWSRETEIRDLSMFDIGIMPLPNDEWSKGKCGFKALQYMAMSIPAVASPVGINIEIIDHGVNGFLCKSNEEWITALEKLIQDKNLRDRLGQNGRRRVVDHYSLASNVDNFLSLFE